MLLKKNGFTNRNDLHCISWQITLQMKSSFYCGKDGHIAKVCRAKQRSQQTSCSLVVADDPVSGELHSCVVYKFVCAGYNACYIGETCHHFSTHVGEHTCRRALTRPLTFSSICKILHIVALCVQQIASTFGSHLYQFPTQDKRGYLYSKRTTILGSKITHCKSKAIPFNSQTFMLYLFSCYHHLS